MGTSPIVVYCMIHMRNRPWGTGAALVCLLISFSQFNGISGQSDADEVVGEDSFSDDLRHIMHKRLKKTVKTAQASSTDDAMGSSSLALGNIRKLKAFCLATKDKAKAMSSTHLTLNSRASVVVGLIDAFAARPANEG